MWRVRSDRGLRVRIYRPFLNRFNGLVQTFDGVRTSAAEYADGIASKGTHHDWLPMPQWIGIHPEPRVFRVSVGIDKKQSMCFRRTVIATQRGPKMSTKVLLSWVSQLAETVSVAVDC